MWRKQVNNSQNCPYGKDSKYSTIRGVKSNHCFLGVMFLMIMILGLFWLYISLGEGLVNSKVQQVGVPMTPVDNTNSELLEKENLSIPIVEDTSLEKYEFRAAWLASVHNLDYPESQAMSKEKLKSSFLKILDVYQLYNLNAVIMQVRPEGDALYLSEINPPSIYVTGSETTSLPFDLLKFAITETHKRGMEFHAWFNPFRVTSLPSEEATDVILGKLHPMNYARINPSSVLRFNNLLFLNPGEVGVRKFVQQTIMEVVRNYDIDAVHLDDYFYPYPTDKINEEGLILPLYFGDNLEDLATFQRDSRGIPDIKAWRRDNTYLFIKELSHEIHDLKPYVKLGISPFGIWGHAEETEGQGSNTPLTSQETYHHSIFADTRKWIKEELVDYVIPQLYWSKDNASAPYEELATWWNQTVDGTNVHLYIGQGLYKLHESQDDSWHMGNPIIDQIAFNNTLENVKGSAFFRFSHLIPDKKIFSGPSQQGLKENAEALKETYAHMAIIPKNQNLNDGRVTSPVDVVMKKEVLSFSDGNEHYAENSLTKTFLIYRFPKDDQNTENPAYLYKRITLEPGEKIYHLNSLNSDDFIYGVSALNRLQEESKVIIANP